MAFDVQGYLKSLDRFGMKPGLERIHALLDRLGRPEAAFPAIHIGGTNGKGSVSAMTESILRHAGYRVGLYTSPHLSRYHERIRVDGRQIADADLRAAFADVAAAASDVRAEMGSDPTEFEVGTAAAFLHFKRAQVDVAVVEVGLGGRLDSTNVVRTLAAAIGPISYDHLAVLGRDLGSIAREKAGIFRPGVPAVVAPQSPEAARALAEAANALSSPLVWVREDIGAGAHHGVSAHDASDPSVHPDQQPAQPDEAFFTVVDWDASGGRFHLRTPRRHFRERKTPLLGYHQVQNASVAVTLVDALGESGFDISETDIRQGLLQARWPGRLELLPGKPRVLLDGVHNRAGAEAFARSFRRIFPGVRPVFVVAITGEKEPVEVLGPFAPFASHMVATRPGSSRVPAVDPEALAAGARALGVPAESRPSSEEALERAFELAGEGGMVCVCGSLYLVGEVRGGLVDGDDAAR